MEITNRLLAWYGASQRDLPWRHTKDPYKIWLSEIIMQQTRVAQGLDYYNRFVSTFPTVFDLASADEQEVLKLWQGLGYYSRARNLHFTAKEIVTKYGGKFPGTYAGLLKLKGVGAYTAAAISSIAFGEVQPVVDGNVMRVMTRLFAIHEPIDSVQGKKMIHQAACELIDPKQPDIFNQAIMDFGALQCTPGNPNCGDCVLQDFCLALERKQVSSLPVKKGKTQVRDRYFYYFFFQIAEKGETYCLLNKRQAGDIWQNLFDFPLLESPTALSEAEILHSPLLKNLTKGVRWEVKGVSKEYLHKLSHQNIRATFICLAAGIPNLDGTAYQLVSGKDMEQFPIPKLIDNYLTARSKVTAPKLF